MFLQMGNFEITHWDVHESTPHMLYLLQESWLKIAQEVFVHSHWFLFTMKHNLPPVPRDRDSLNHNFSLAIV